jgi:hypothetical protein
MEQKRDVLTRQHKNSISVKGFMRTRALYEQWDAEYLAAAKANASAATRSKKPGLGAGLAHGSEALTTSMLLYRIPDSARTSCAASKPSTMSSTGAGLIRSCASRAAMRSMYASLRCPKHNARYEWVN